MIKSPQDNQLKNLADSFHYPGFRSEPHPRWMWDGRWVDVTEFAELAYGDSAKRTEFLLKYAK